MPAMCASRRELFWSLLLFLLSSGGISFADQQSTFSAKRLFESADNCAISSDQLVGCLKAVRVLLDNAKIAQHLSWKNSQIIEIRGIQRDLEEESLEKKANSLKPEQIKMLSVGTIFREAIQNSTLEEDLLHEALNAYLSANDPHARMASEPTQALWGIGAFLRRHQDSLHVLEVLPQSQAAKAGLEEGDQILRINNFAVDEISNFQRHKLFQLATKHGEFLALDILRNQHQIRLSIQAEQASFRTVESSAMGNIGIIKLRNFSRQDSCQAVAMGLRKLDKAQVRGIVLDLRDNPGGLVHEAICIGGLFMGPNILMAKLESMDSKNQQSQLFTYGNKLNELPMLVLVNENTASAAEIVAAALQDQKRAKVIGARTFGKGSMQSLFHEDVPVYRSTHRIFRATGSPIQKVGIAPNYELKENYTALREVDLYGNILAKYGPIAAPPKQRAKASDPCTQKALQRSPLDASASLLRCSL